MSEMSENLQVGRAGERNTFAENDATPVLRGEIFAPGRVRVWCSFCRTYHVHGWPPGTPDDALEHRVAHCLNKSGPYARTGYHIRLERAA
jgi:hypothetical protein